MTLLCSQTLTGLGIPGVLLNPWETHGKPPGNPHPWTRVWVSTGRGAGCPEKPQGSPPHSLLKVPPFPLYNLFTCNTHQAKDFSSNIVQYNAALAFTSLGININHSVIGGGPPVFQIQGELRHLSGYLLPEQSDTLKHSQLYVYDPHMAYRYHISHNKTYCFILCMCFKTTLIHVFINMHTKYSKSMIYLITLWNYVLFQCQNLVVMWFPELRNLSRSVRHSGELVVARV